MTVRICHGLVYMDITFDLGTLSSSRLVRLKAEVTWVDKCVHGDQQADCSQNCRPVTQDTCTVSVPRVWQENKNTESSAHLCESTRVGSENKTSKSLNSIIISPLSKFPAVHKGNMNEQEHGHVERSIARKPLLGTPVARIRMYITYRDASLVAKFLKNQTPALQNFRRA